MKKELAADVDRRAWAAYVVGHHAQTLRLLQEMRWTLYVVPKSETYEKEDVGGFGVELAEMRLALRLLALADEVRGGVLVELHRALDQLDTVFRDKPKSQQFSALTTSSPPGLEEWNEVVTLAGHLLKPTSDLTAWVELGALLGRSQLLLRVRPEIDHVGLAQEMTEAEGLVTELRTPQQYDFLQDVKRLADSVAPRGKNRSPSTGLGHTNLYLEFARVDQHVRYALQEQKAPEPVLVLSRKKLMLFGETLELAGHSQDQIACLWILADNAGKPVPRKTILKESNIGVDTKDTSLRSIVNRLRENMLRPLIRKYRRRHGGPPLPGEKRAFIIGRDKKKGGTYKLGIYMLQLDPARVRVDGPRPKWMAHS